MTIEEVIEYLKSLVEVRRKYGDMQTMKDEIECLDMGVKALTAISELSKSLKAVNRYDMDEKVLIGFNMAVAIFNECFGEVGEKDGGRIMTEYIILNRIDMSKLCDDKPITIYINKKPYVLCTDEYFTILNKKEGEEEK